MFNTTHPGGSYLGKNKVFAMSIKLLAKTVFN
jgi:hypothetical protein